jgi:hypothetical protein
MAKVKHLEKAIFDRLKNALDQSVFVKNSKIPAVDSDSPDPETDLGRLSEQPMPAPVEAPKNQLEQIVDHVFAKKWQSELTSGCSDADDAGFEEIVERLTALESEVKKLTDQLARR